LPTVGLVEQLREGGRGTDFVYDGSLFDCSAERNLYDVVKVSEISFVVVLLELTLRLISEYQ
jgi:hypothetical protein